MPALRRRVPAVKVVSTFAGCGGSSLGYEMAGCEVVAAVEWDAHAAECYRLNHPATRVFEGDIAAVKGADILDATGLDVGALDVLDGSPPCQGFSMAGRRAIDDPRNQLFREHMRLVRELRPRHVVIENVAGMLRGAMLPVAHEIVAALRAEGYNVAAGLCEAWWFGVAQRCPRVFFVGSRDRSPVLPPPVRSRPVTSGEALRGVEPDEVLLPANAGQRLMATHLRPGENGSDVMRRVGRKDGWYNCGMLDRSEAAPTITKTMQGYGSLYHWTRRHVSVREALVLTGFPASYQLPGSFSDRWARVGNSVAPPVTAAIARSLRGSA